MFMRSGYRAHTRKVGCGSGTEEHHLAARVLRRLRHDVASGRAQAKRLRLALELVAGQPVEPDPVVLDRVAALGVDNLPAAFEHESIGSGSHRGWAARVDDTVDLADVRGWSRHPVRDVVFLEVLVEGDGEQPAAVEMSVRAAEKVGPLPR